MSGGLGEPVEDGFDRAPELDSDVVPTDAFGDAFDRVAVPAGRLDRLSEQARSAEQDPSVEQDPSIEPGFRGTEGPTESAPSAWAGRSPGSSQGRGSGSGRPSNRGRAGGRDRAGSGGRAGRGGQGRGRRPGREEPRDGDVDRGEMADPESVARTIVLRKLTAQARTRNELATALQQRAVPPEVATAVLDRMTEVGLVDDTAFASDWVASRQSRRHLSASALRRELNGKGVAREDIDAALEQVSDDDELEAARALAERKVRSLRGLEPVVRRRRLAGVLARRGFSSRVTSTVLAEVLSGAAATELDDS